MDLKEKMEKGFMYNDLSEVLINDREKTVFLTNEYNLSYGKPKEVREAILDRLLKIHGENTFFEPNFRCEYGYRITIGDNFYANFDCVILDSANVTIGDNVLFGPRVSIYCTNHAVDPIERINGACYAKPITIGNNVWIGGGVNITQGVTIGNNSIIGAGSLVNKDIPDNVIAAGVPCKVIREITEADKTGYKEILK